jgi:hypothetical protein
MTALLGVAVLRQVQVPTDPITVSPKTTEVADHPVEEVDLGVEGVTEVMMEAKAIVPMTKVLLTTATTTGLKIHSIKIPQIPVTVDLHHLLSLESHPVHQTTTLRVLTILKVRLKLRLK